MRRSKVWRADLVSFNSIWQRQADGRWLVVFDKGSPPDPPAPK